MGTDIEEEGGNTSGNIGSIVGGEICCRKKEILVCLLLIDKVAKHSNKGAISSLYLIIDLRVKSHRYSEMDIQEPTEFLPKAIGELYIPI